MFPMLREITCLVLVKKETTCDRSVQSVACGSLIICRNQFFPLLCLPRLSFRNTAASLIRDELLELCECFSQGGGWWLGGEGTRHPNLIQTHSSPEGIKGEWGLGELFPKQERLLFSIHRSIAVNKRVEMAKLRSDSRNSGPLLKLTLLSTKKAVWFSGMLGCSSFTLKRWGFLSHKEEKEPDNWKVVEKWWDLSSLFYLYIWSQCCGHPGFSDSCRWVWGLTPLKCEDVQL